MKNKDLLFADKYGREVPAPEREKRPREVSKLEATALCTYAGQWSRAIRPATIIESTAIERMFARFAATIYDRGQR